MADKSVSELVAATQVNPTDLFVLEQGGSAKKLTGQILENWLVSFANGHGGIQSIAKTGTSGLVDTYTITMADTSTFSFDVQNGNGISSITWTTSGTAGNGQTHTGTIHYTDGSTSSVTLKDGVKGNTGAAWYMHIKYSAVQPTSDSDMGNSPDEWIGIYSGTSATAPTSYTSYTWYKIRGAKGETGDPAQIVSKEIKYQTSNSGTTVPTGTWSDTPSTVSPGVYLWTRVTLRFNVGDPVVWYSVGYNGVNGTGAVSTVNGELPDSNGDVTIDAELIANIPTAAQYQSDCLAKDIQTIRSDISNKQSTISTTGMLKCTGSGIVAAAQKGTDYGALSFTVTVPTSGWSSVQGGGYSINVSNPNFLASGYAYSLSPKRSSLSDYMDSVLYADDVTTDGRITFYCENTPDNPIDMNVIRTVTA